MASKETWRERANKAFDDWAALSEEIDALEADWGRERTEYEADLNAAVSRADKATELLNAQQAKFDGVLRERDQLRGQLSRVRAQFDGLRQELFPATYASGGLVGPMPDGCADTIVPLTQPGYTLSKSQVQKLGPVGQLFADLNARDSQQALSKW